MGEWSKRVGENGERIVDEFLELIGWVRPVRGIDIPSINPQKHKRLGSKGGRKTHGIDFLFRYRSNLISNTLVNVLISSKATNDPYPSNPKSDFKDYFVDIAQALESFPKSAIKQDGVDMNGIDQVYDYGVVFWTSNDRSNSKNDIISQVSSAKLPTDYDYNGIFLVDNRRAAFVYNALLYAKNTGQGAKVDFVYFKTGYNDAPEVTEYGSVMPIQYLNSSILPLRISYPADSNKATLMIAVIDEFDHDTFSRVLGMAKSIAISFQANTIICFPEYNGLEMENTANTVIQNFGNDGTGFFENLTIDSLNLDFRN